MAEHDPDAPPEYRRLALASEAGELVEDACESTGSGSESDVSERDDAGDALAKYESRLSETGGPGAP